ncbi:CcdB family protein [Halomonas urumqiensis]|uniref:Toxin CcdB n=1 Tax=Halomonas urumqiensis TaxID=1684789 RepID=A0A2N7UH18_9GAMM|nr:CcdB family protein [Halomonas urumqiensis]PMR79757.1 plasmid maintenance protein CcdB [Halomonas urumqiensis]PTB00960.1 plasmid maintenance protein CcdB [Halomonas urumqiensis]GHE23011.1 hypothetical protein GCM10017767_35320 [Halomonas urumqiensis]
MAQFDVYSNPSKASKALYPYLVDVQSDILSDLATRLVIPLCKHSDFGGQPIQGLTPQIELEGQALLLLTPQISSIPARHLNHPIGSLAHFRGQIVGALDLVISGF